MFYFSKYFYSYCKYHGNQGMQMKNIFLFIWYSLTFSRTWPAPGRSFSTIGGGGRGGVLPPTTPHFPPTSPRYLPPTKFVWCQIEAIRHHTPLTPLIFVVPIWGYSAPRVVPNSPKLAPQKWGGGRFVVPNSPKLAPRKWGGWDLWCRIAASLY